MAGIGLKRGYADILQSYRKVAGEVALKETKKGKEKMENIRDGKFLKQIYF